MRVTTAMTIVASAIRAAVICHSASANPVPVDCAAISVLSPTSAAPGMAVVTAPGRTVVEPGFVSDAGKRTSVYLVQGDDVVLLVTDGARACVVFTGKGPSARSTEGWVASGSLTARTPPSPERNQWLGKWSGGAEKELAFSARIGGGPFPFTVTGSASYGALDPARVASGGINLGDISGDVALASTRAQADFHGECAVRFWLMDPYLIAADDGNCGGHNVTFTGIYRHLGG